MDFSGDFLPADGRNKCGLLKKLLLYFAKSNEYALRITKLLEKLC